jgi:hypothetical protein
MNLLKKQRDAVGFKHLFEKYEFYAPERSDRPQNAIKSTGESARRSKDVKIPTRSLFFVK